MMELLPMRKNAGFTLIELLVVIAIIGVMSALGLTLFSEAQKKTRDGQRKIDITSYAKALEIHKTDSGYQQLQTSWFEKGVKPADPVSGGHYCGCDNDTNATDLTDSDWTSVTTSCPGAGIAGCDTAWVDVSTTAFPTANATYWRICAHLEIEDTVFCKHNVQ